MKDTYNLSEFRSCLRILLLLAIALLLSGPPHLWAQCIFPRVNASVSPSSVVEGNPVTLTITITMSSPLQVCDGNGGNPVEVIWGIRASDGRMLGQGGFNMAFGQSSFTFTLYANDFGYTHPITATLAAAAWANGPAGKVAYLYIIPGNLAANPGDLGQSECPITCGHPINLTNGNVWIRQRDYAVPGLGGGLELTRTWNSRWMGASPPAFAGMFGHSWRSTYEEALTGPYANNHLMYWRGDGSGWTFTYNSVLNSYSLSSPPNERAQLVSNPTGGFTLTLADGTQKVFNSQDLLAAVIDRNHNQTTLAYDSSNRLTSVTSPGGSTLTFTYGDANNPMQVTTVQDSVGVVATYTYDSSSRLTSVTYPDTSALNFTYDPNSSMLLSVTDSQGKLLESHTYDAQDRGLTSSRAYGVDSVSLTY
jgi:YD repeat-containing protein